MSTQKQLTTLIVIVASLVSFLGGYLLTQSGNPAKLIQEQRGNLIDRFQGVPSGATPTPLSPGLYQISQDSTLAPVSLPVSDAVEYYHPDNGFVSRVDLESRQETLISQTNLPKLVNVIWSSDRNRVITSNQKAGRLTFSYFDYTTRIHGSLGTNIGDAVFSPDGQKVAILRMLPSSDASDIQIADFNGQNVQSILKTRLTGIKLFWPAANTLAFMASDPDTNTKSLYLLSTSGELSQIFSSADQLSLKWSESGDALIYSDLEDGNLVLHYIKLADDQDQKLDLTAAAQNCDWLDGGNIICAQETQGETSIVKIDLATQTSAVLFSNLIISPQQAFLSASKNFLTLIAASDQSVWAVKLK